MYNIISYLGLARHYTVQLIVCLPVLQHYCECDTTLREKTIVGMQHFSVLFVFNVVEAVFLELGRPKTTHLSSDYAET